MTHPSNIRLAVIGVGAMGSAHVRDLCNMPDVTLAAVCDINRERADRVAAQANAPVFYDYHDLLKRGGIDAVIIATPHYFHTPIAIDFLQQGVNVLTEKPIGVHMNDARKMISAYEQSKVKNPNLTFAIMFQQRTYGFWRKIKELIDSGELGKLVRTTWIITDWFRTQSYYDNGGWRATWQGEGGGVLLNQCPHNLDLYQWLVGMPNRVAGFAHIGKYHHIEVEDEVTGYFEHENGMVGHFITTTAEAPGTNRLEIHGEKGKIVFEDGHLTFFRNRSSMLEFIKTCPGGFDKVENWTINIPYTHHGEPGHRIMIQNFLDTMRGGETLIAPASEGLHSLELSNAMMLSSFLGHPLDLPIDGDAYEARLNELIAGSDFQKTIREHDEADWNKSFNIPSTNNQ